MKRRYFLYTLLITFVLSSCGIEKRLYRPGFYIQDKTLSRKTSGLEVSREKADSSVIVCQPSVADKVEIKKEDPLPPANLRIFPKKSAHLSYKHTIKQNSSGEFHAKKTMIESATKKAIYDEDSVLLVGCLIAVAGILLIAIAVSLASSLAALASALFISGIVVASLGLIIAGIAYPEMFFEILCSVIMAL